MNRSQETEPGTTYRCEKHRIDMCETGLKCRDPELYCKFRSACMIRFMEKEKQRHRPSSLKKPAGHDPTEPSL